MKSSLYKAVLLLLTLLWCAGLISAQETVVASYPQSAQRINQLAAVLVKVPDCSSNVVTLPFKRSGKLLLIEAEANGIRGNFVFDTGAPYLVLNSTYFRDGKSSSTDATGITGGGLSFETLRLDSFNIREIQYGRLYADVVPLGHIENARGIKILGLLGLNLFEGFEIEIDVMNNLLMLYKCTKDGNTISAPPFSPYFTEKISVTNNAIVVKGQIAGKNLNFILDSGAEINTLSSTSNKVVLETISIEGRSRLMGTGSASVDVLFGTMSDFSISGTAFNGMKTLITNLGNMSDAYGTFVDGMLGYDFLEKGRIRLNLKKKTLSIGFFDNLEDTEE